MTNLRRTVMMAARSKSAALPHNKALEAGRARAFGGADHKDDDDDDDEDRYRRAVDILRDFHRRAHTLDVIYEEEGRDPAASGTAARRDGTGLAAAGAPHMLKVRTTGSLLDLVPPDEESIVTRQHQQRHESAARWSPPSETGSHDVNNSNSSGAMDWGYFDDDNDDPSSVVIPGDVVESDTRRMLQGTAVRRILCPPYHSQRHARHQHRRQPRRHHGARGQLSQHAENDQHPI